MLAHNNSGRSGFNGKSASPQRAGLKCIEGRLCVKHLQLLYWSFPWRSPAAPSMTGRITAGNMRPHTTSAFLNVAFTMGSMWDVTTFPEAGGPMQTVMGVSETLLSRVGQLTITDTDSTRATSAHSAVTAIEIMIGAESRREFFCAEDSFPMSQNRDMGHPFAA